MNFVEHTRCCILGSCRIHEVLYLGFLRLSMYCLDYNFNFTFYLTRFSITTFWFCISLKLHFIEKQVTVIRNNFLWTDVWKLNVKLYRWKSSEGSLQREERQRKYPLPLYEMVRSSDGKAEVEQEFFYALN